ncbi:MAG: DUF2062 domain-containing protein [Cytophagales bacterium]|nr:DUF2062 domain-containing protein [Cytophagales bacterium]
MKKAWNRLWELLIKQLYAGSSPHRLALMLSLGLAIGIFPVLGTCTVLAALAALAFRLNLIGMQLLNYLVYPLQLALMAPFVLLGHWAWPGASAHQTVVGQEFAELLAEHDLWHLSGHLLHLVGYGILGWALVMIPCGVLMYCVFSILIKKLHSMSDLSCDDKQQYYLTRPYYYSIAKN